MSYEIPQITGSLKFNKPPTKELVDYIRLFGNIRHMIRNVEKIKRIDPNWEQHCFNGNLGIEGEYYIPYKEDDSFDPITSVTEKNCYPKTQPNFYCHWFINIDNELVWDGNPFFNQNIQWLQYLIKNFFEPLGYVLNGELETTVKICVEDNKITTRENNKKGRIIWKEK